MQNIRYNLGKLLKIVLRETSFHPENLAAYCTVSRDCFFYSIPTGADEKKIPGDIRNLGRPCCVLVSFFICSFLRFSKTGTKSFKFPNNHLDITN